MWVLFGLFLMFFNFYGLDSHNKSCVALATLRCNICKNRNENRTSLKWVMIIGSACLLISSLNTWILSIVVIIECRVVIDIWRRSPMSSEHESLWCLPFDPHWSIYQSNIGAWIRIWTIEDSSTLTLRSLPYQVEFFCE